MKNTSWLALVLLLALPAYAADKASRPDPPSQAASTEQTVSDRVKAQIGDLAVSVIELQAQLAEERQKRQSCEQKLKK